MAMEETSGGGGHERRKGVEEQGGGRVARVRERVKGEDEGERERASRIRGEEERARQ